MSQTVIETPLQAIFKRAKSAMLYCALFSFPVNLLVLTVPIFMMQLFDRVLTSRSVETLIYLSVIALALLAMMALFDALRSRIMLHVSLWMDRQLALPTFRRAIDAGVRGSAYKGDALRDLMVVKNFFAGNAMMTIFDAPWAPFYLLIIYLLHPTLFMIAFVGALVLLALAWMNEAMTHKSLQGANIITRLGLRRIESVIRNAAVIDAMGLRENIGQAWETDNQNGRTFQAEAGAKGGTILAISKFARLSIQILMLGVGAYLAIGQEITGGAMLAASIIVGRALAPMERAIGSWKLIADTLASYQRLKGFYLKPPLRPDGDPLPAPDPFVQVENVSYVFPGTGEPILRGISFAIKPGGTLGIVGPTASGKSTLAHLLIGSAEPTAGVVRLGGADVFNWPRPDFGQYVGYMPQEVELFAGTVAQNIARMGNSTPEQIYEAAKLAGVHEMILRLPKGYETDIGDDGARLSGGQRQRLALARALHGNPRYLVMDEPNSNLDEEGEDALRRAINEMKARGTTIIVVGHRPAGLEGIENFLMLRNGMVDLIGSRDEVIETVKQRHMKATAARQAATNQQAPQPQQAPLDLSDPVNEKKS